jgi:hypothetical protein
MTDLPVAFRDLPAEAFPFTVQLLDAGTREVRWEQVVEGPCALRVPPRHEVNDGRMLVSRIVYADGRTEEAGQDG